MENKDLFTESSDQTLMAAFAWWEKRRIIFNVLVGITGACFLFLLTDFSSFDLFGILIYGTIANLCYSLGFFIEIAAKHYFQQEIDFTEKRKLLFVFGIVISIIITIGFGVFSILLKMI